MTGFISIIGAGPGDPELLTVKAALRLQEADLVLYDALVSTETLHFAPRAKCFCVGKRSGQRSVSQETTEKLMIRAARRGERVVRLKSGDPFVLGRGGEEAWRLTREGIPYEVIPGVSAAISAPAAAGIPLTHRGVSSGFMVTSGHSPAVYGPLIEGCPPNGLTLVFLMGTQAGPDIAKALLRHRWLPTTPAALIFGASTPGQVAWKGTLTDLRDGPEVLDGPETRSPLPGGGKLPGTLVVGEVVALTSHIHTETPWLETPTPCYNPQSAHQGH